MQRTREQAHRDGYVETLFGRRLYLNEINSRNQGLRAGAERAAINAPMQGTAADIIKRAMVSVDAWLQTQKDAARMIMQVHDELVFEVREDRIDAVSAGVRERMNAAAELLCRSSSISASATTGTRRIDAASSEFHVDAVWRATQRFAVVLARFNAGFLTRIIWLARK